MSWNCPPNNQRVDSSDRKGRRAIGESATETSRSTERVAEASDEKTEHLGEIGRMPLDAVETAHDVSGTVEELRESVAGQRAQVTHLGAPVSDPGGITEDSLDGEPARPD